MNVPVRKNFDLSYDSTFFPDFIGKGLHKGRSLCRYSALCDEYHFVEWHGCYFDLIKSTKQIINYSHKLRAINSISIQPLHFYYVFEMYLDGIIKAC